MQILEAESVKKSAFINLKIGERRRTKRANRKGRSKGPARILSQKSQSEKSKESLYQTQASEHSKAVQFVWQQRRASKR